MPFLVFSALCMVWRKFNKYNVFHIHLRNWCSRLATCYCLVLFQLFSLLFLARVASQSRTLRKLLHYPFLNPTRLQSYLNSCENVDFSMYLAVYEDKSKRFRSLSSLCWLVNSLLPDFYWRLVRTTLHIEIYLHGSLSNEPHFFWGTIRPLAAYIAKTFPGREKNVLRKDWKVTERAPMEENDWIWLLK